MAIKQFAVPLDEMSDESGDINFKELVNANANAVFELTNVTSSTSANELNLITKKNGVAKDHKFNSTVSGGKATVVLSSSNLSTVYNDANGGNWDYVEAKWTVEHVDTPNPSNMFVVQNGGVHDTFGWPPNS